MWFHYRGSECSFHFFEAPPRHLSLSFFSFLLLQISFCSPISSQLFELDFHLLSNAFAFVFSFFRSFISNLSSRLAFPIPGLFLSCDYSSSLSLSLALSPRETSAIKRHFSYAAYIEQSPFFFLLLLYGKVFLRSVRIYFVELRKYSPEKSEHIVAHGISNPSNPFSVSSPFVSPFCSSTVSSFNVSAYISTPPVQIFR